MDRRRHHTNAAPLFAAAALSYAANCALGTAVTARIVDTSSFRWLHHALYILTCTLSAAAVSSAWWGTPRSASRQAAFVLVPAAVPLAVIAYAPAHSRRHPAVALAAAPFIALGFAFSRRPANRK